MTARNILIALLLVLVIVHFAHGGIPLMASGSLGLVLLILLVLVLAGVL